MNRMKSSLTLLMISFLVIFAGCGSENPDENQGYADTGTEDPDAGNIDADDPDVDGDEDAEVDDASVDDADENDTEIGEPDADNEDAAPEFTATPSSIYFPQPALGDSANATVHIENTGTGGLVLSNFRIDSLNGSNHAALSEGADWPEDEVVLQANEAIELTVVYTHESTDATAGVLLIDTNIDDFETAEIALYTMATVPELFVPDHVAFPLAPDGTSDWQILEISNLGNAPLIIEDLVVEGSDVFDITFPGDLTAGGDLPPAASDADTFDEAHIAQNEMMRVRVWVHSTGSAAQGNLIISSSDPINPETNVSLVHGN